MNTLKTICAAALLATATSLPANQATIDNLKKEFAGVRALELPARAASTVAAAKQADRASIAEDVVRAALDVNGSSGPMLVGAISRSTPDAAAVSATTAATTQPKQLSAITRAAVGAAPTQAEAIVAAMTKARPASFAAIGISAVDVSPKSASAILSGVVSANPTLKTLISRVDTKGAKTAPEVVTVLKRTDALIAKLSASTKSTPETVLANELTPAMVAQLPTITATVMAAPPVVGPPYTPASPGTPEVGTTSEAPARSRDYSGP